MFEQSVSMFGPADNVFEEEGRGFESGRAHPPTPTPHPSLCSASGGRSEVEADEFAVVPREYILTAAMAAAIAQHFSGVWLFISGAPLVLLTKIG